MANENNKTTTNEQPPAQEGPKKLPELERLKLAHEIALRLMPLVPDDRRYVLQSLATTLGVSSSSAQRQQAAQRQQPPAQQQRNGGR